MIFCVQQMQYNAPNRMYVCQNVSEGDTPGPPFGGVTQNMAPPLQNPGCAPVRGKSVVKMVLATDDDRQTRVFVVVHEYILLLTGVTQFDGHQLAWRKNVAARYAAILFVHGNVGR